MRHLGRRRLVRRSGEEYLRNLFASSFLQKDENPLPRHTISKYDAGQGIRTGTHESSDVSSGEILKLHARKHRTGTVHDGRGGGLSNAGHLQNLIYERRDTKEAWDVAY